MTINERVKTIRLKLGMTQKEMGQRLTLAQTYLSQIEKGDRDVTDKIFKIICLEFNVREEYLRDGIEPIFEENDKTIISELTKQYKLNDLDKSIIQIFLELSPEKRELLKDFAFSLVDTVLNDDSLYMEYRERYISENALPFAARNGDTSNLDEAAELFDKAIEEKTDKENI